MRDIILRKGHPVSAMDKGGKATCCLDAALGGKKVIVGPFGATIGKVEIGACKGPSKGSRILRPGGKMPVGIRDMDPVFIGIVWICLRLKCQ